MSDLISRAKPAVDALSNFDDDKLYTELGARLQAIGRAPEGSDQFDMKLTQSLESYGPADGCLLCHSPSSPADMTALTHAPKLSPSHLVSRDGQTGPDVTASHRFCASCHVIQTEASPPVGNTFRSTNREPR